MTTLKNILSALLILGSTMLLAQAPSNTTLIGGEGITVISTTGTGVAYEFGTVAKYNTVTSAKYPLVVNCGSAFAAQCALLGGDPAPPGGPSDASR